MSETTLGLVTAAAALFLAVRALQGHGLPRQRMLIMIAAWIAIIGLLALVLGWADVQPQGGVADDFN